MRKTAVVFVSILSIFADFACAGTSGLDATFGSGGIVLLGPTPVSGIASPHVRAMRVQDDGKILIAGNAYSPIGGTPVPAVGRLTFDGQWDTTFADHGLFVLPYGADAAPYGGRLDAVSIFSTGEIVAAGGTYQFGGNWYSCTLLIKLTSAGVLDTGFAPDKSGSYCFDFAPPPANNFWYSHWDDLKVDSDDTFFLTAISTNLSRGAVAHLDSSGTLVNTFGTNGIAGLPDGIYTNRLELPGGHQALAAGVVGTPTSEAVGASVVDVHGDVDLSYGTNGVGVLDEQPSTYYGTVFSARDAQGRLLLSSDSTTNGVDDSPYRLERFTGDGKGDSTFNGSGQQPGMAAIAVLSLSTPTSFYDVIAAATPTADGHIVVVGGVGYVGAGDGVQDIALIRLNDDSSYDTSFGQVAHPGWVSINIGGLDTSMGRPDTLTMDTSGRILVAFGASDSNGKGCGGLLRIVPDRLLDASFESATPLPTCPQ